MENEEKNIAFLRDSDWSIIDGSPCRILNFIPMAAIKDGKVIANSKTKPYASIIFENKNLLKKTNGLITNKLDFKSLSLAFGEVEAKEDEEVIIFWSKKHYKNFLYKILSPFMPKLWVMVCRKGVYDLMTNDNYRPELRGEARFNATSVIIDWKPEVMK